jgi:Molecular chaperone (small heat shock protein)
MKRSKIEKEKKLDVYRPFEALDRMDDFFDYATKIPYKLLNNYFSSYKTPDADIIDNGDSYTIKIDLPGIDKKNIKLKVLGDSIEVRAEKNEEKEEHKAGYYSKERALDGILQKHTAAGEDKTQERQGKDGERHSQN